MKQRYLPAIAALLIAAVALGGCEQLSGISDTVGHWFSGKSKSNLKGERIPVMSSAESASADPALAKVPVVLPPPYRNSAWPEPGGYANNAMYHLEAGGPLQIVWRADAGKGTDSDSRLTTPPIVADGRIYVLDSEAHIYVFDAQSGKPVWDQSVARTGGNATFLNETTFGLLGKNTTINPNKGFGGGIAYDDGKVFVSTGFGDVFAMNAATGARIWKADLGVPIVNAPVANGGRVFISSVDNHFYALAESDGRQLWDHQGITESAGILESTSAAVSGEYVIAPYTSGELYALRADTGAASWNDTLTRTGTVTALSELDDIAGRPVIDRDLVIAASHSGVMAAINLHTGDRVWSQDIASIQTPWAAGDFLYVLSVNNQLLCLERKSGKVKWIHQLSRWEDPRDQEDAIVWSGPVLVSNRLIVVSTTGVIASLSPYDGKLLGEMQFPGGTVIAPIVANDTLYILTKHAELLALR